MSRPAALAAVALAAALAAPAVPSAQARRGSTPARQAATATRTEPAKFTCPNVLGDGVRTGRTYCDVTIGRAAEQGIIIPLPPHTGPVTLIFDLHNRHTYSEELAKTSRGYRRYTATIGVMALDNTLLSRFVVHNEVRAAADLFDRIAGGAGAGGVKAVAPTGIESVRLSIDAAETSVSILGEKLTEDRVDAGPISDTFTAEGRPVAVISNVMLEYRPGPAPRAPARRR